MRQADAATSAYAGEIMDWARERFGIEDEAELAEIVNDPANVLAMMDVMREGDP
jgi:hypothetical protein